MRQSNTKKDERHRQFNKKPLMRVEVMTKINSLGTADPRDRVVILSFDWTLIFKVPAMIEAGSEK